MAKRQTTPPPAWLGEMVTRLTAAVNGEKATVVAEYAFNTGKSTAQLYRLAKQHGYHPGRKCRTDKGVLKSGVTPEQIQLVSTLIQTTSREVKGAIMPVEVAVRIAEDNGYMEAGQVSVNRMQCLLRERELTGAALATATPHTPLRSLHPNHVHVFDASVCIQYYLKQGGLAIMDERSFYKNKPDAFAKIKQKLIRMVLVDHCSHNLYLQYYLAAGENQRMTFDFLTRAWRGGWHEKQPMRGVPLYLLMDAGSANIARGILGFLKALGVETPQNLPHNPRRQGSAECMQNLVERHFESPLRLDPACTIDELNVRALDWGAWWCGSKTHTRHGMTRIACWQTIIQAQIRDLPADDLLRDYYAEPEVDRLIHGDYTVKFRGAEYRVKHIPGLIPNRTHVTVSLRLMHWPQVAVLHEGVEYLVDPVQRGAYGFDTQAAVIGQEYKAQPESQAQKSSKINQNLAYGEEKKKGAVPFDGALQVYGHLAVKLGNVTPLPRTGTPLPVGRDLVVQEIPILELLQRVRQRQGSVPPALNAELRAALGESVEVQTAEAVVAALAEGRDWRVVASGEEQVASG